ncbi:tetratricopeptide repeat protein [Colwellia sp. Bg11-28]|uniref:tetratricopeptide repeat protein n=1 Tax=Colwellia sp. Bg11-28 TaxID=2058305 RepID=UPI000C329654|nr:tetratricopeptide repeat protein [Colwellia sp. Bg11-28]PKH85744.1 flagellar protein MotX [Colwellia sp. Bg11-28]
MRILFFFVLSVIFLFSSSSALAMKKNLQAVQIYTDNQLLDLIKDNKHLSQVVLDECQLVQDIEARANKANMPSYQFLWGDMLAYGVCVKKDIPLGLHYMHLAADQGLAEGLEQLGRYYHMGKFMQVDIDRAIVYLKTAASLDNLAAQMRLASLYEQGYGSPLDYPALYSQLHHSVTDDKVIHKQISVLISGLASKMPSKVIEQAKRTSYTN